jgi:site-specific DNA-cytosine methylase
MNSSNPYSGCREVECAKTLDTTIPTPTKNQGGIGIVQNLVIRRLTVVECERLMGFPDNYTETLSINQRYRVLGNSMAVPVVEWIGKQIINAVSY